MSTIFQTTNVALAATLATCGVPFDCHPVTRAPLPFVNYYTREILQKLGYAGSGMTLDAAALDAWQRRLPGKVVYCFQKTGPFEVVVDAFNRQAEAISRADDQAGGVGSQTLAVLPVAPEVAAAICCQFAKNRKALLEGWHTAIPWMCLPGDVETRHEGGREYRVGSMKLYTIGASSTLKSQIGLN